MKFRKHTSVIEEVELTFSKNVRVPKWAFAYDCCHLCNVEFDSVENTDDDVIRAVDDNDENYWCFCLRCFAEIKKDELERSAIGVLNMEDIDASGIHGGIRYEEGDGR